MTTANRLLVIGDSPSFDLVAEKVSRGSHTVVARCGSPQELVSVVANTRRERFGGDLIDVLDIHDHHAGNGIVLGSKQEILFNVASAALVCNTSVADLATHLRATAQVRLLGCDIAFESGESVAATASDALSRRFLLQALADLLNRDKNLEYRVVFGTNGLIDANSFSDSGFAGDLIQRGLFSSLAAPFADPLSYDEQRTRLALLRMHSL